MKICSRCRESKEESQFNKQSRAKDGLKGICKECDKLLNKERYIRLEDKIIAQVKVWQSKNPTKVAEAKRKYKAKQSQLPHHD